MTMSSLCVNFLASQRLMASTRALTLLLIIQIVKVKTPYSRPRFVIDIQNCQNVNARPDFVTARDPTQTKF